MKWPVHAVQFTCASPLGPLRLCATAKGLAGLWFHDQRHLPPETTFQQWPTHADDPVCVEAQKQLYAYFAGTLQRFDMPLDLSSGTAFQREVWQRLLSIPTGMTQTYGAIAQAIGRSAAVRAVGAAVGRNPVSIIVPCHRVMGANGSLTGYAGGRARKTRLLHLEGSNPEST
jgi:methylated-DNA-[protein]-cysteine S-methyltransferase